MSDTNTGPISSAASSACTYFQELRDQGLNIDFNNITSEIARIPQVFVNTICHAAEAAQENPNLINYSNLTPIGTGVILGITGIYCGIKAVKKTFDTVMYSREHLKSALGYTTASLFCFTGSFYCLHKISVDILSNACSQTKTS